MDPNLTEVNMVAGTAYDGDDIMFNGGRSMFGEALGPAKTELAKETLGGGKPTLREKYARTKKPAGECEDSGMMQSGDGSVFHTDGGGKERHGTSKSKVRKMTAPKMAAPTSEAMFGRVRTRK